MGYRMQTGQLSTEQIISSVAQLGAPELEQVFDRVLALRAERRAPHLSAVEASLLERINQAWPALRARMNQLKAKRNRGVISDAEDTELSELSQQAEIWHAERMAQLAQLAQLRGVSLPVLLGQLGISFPEHG